MTILDGCVAAQFRHVVFVGSSKGATGALLWSSIANGSKSNLKITCIAFSPQTMLYPLNKNLSILPSYRRWANSRNAANHLVKDFRFYGNIPKQILGKIPQTKIYYSYNNTMDRLEANKLKGIPRVELIPLELPFHGAIMPFITNTRDKQKVSALTEKLYRDAQSDKDLAASLPSSRKQFTDALSQMIKSDLSDVIKDHVNQTDIEKIRWLYFRIFIMRIKILLR